MSELFKQIKIGETTYDVGANAENVAFNENTSVKEQIQNNIDSIKNKADKSSIGNGTVTIAQGGESKGSFSMNQSEDITINLDAGGSGGGGVAATDAVIENSLTVKGYVVEGEGHNIITESLKVLLTDFSSQSNGYLSIYRDTDNNTPLEGYVYVFGDTGCPSLDRKYAEIAKDLISQIKQYTTDATLDVVCSISNIDTPNISGKMWIGYETQERLYFSFSEMRIFEGVSELKLVKFTTVIGDWYELTSPISINDIASKDIFNMNTQFYSYIYDNKYSHKSKCVLTYSEMENIKTKIDINKYYKGIIDNKEYIDCLIAFEKNDCGTQNILSIYSTGSIGQTSDGTGIGDVTINNISLTHTDSSSMQFGHYSHSEGLGTIATGDYQHVQGKYNIIDKEYAHVVGGGASEKDRKNIHTLDWNGNAYFAGDINLKTSRWITIEEKAIPLTLFSNKTWVNYDNLQLDNIKFPYEITVTDQDNMRLLEILLDYNKFTQYEYYVSTDKQLVMKIDMNSATLFATTPISFSSTSNSVKCTYKYDFNALIKEFSLISTIQNLQSRIAALEAAQS